MKVSIDTHRSFTAFDATIKTVGVLYAGPQINFQGVYDGTRAVVSVEMHPADAADLAMQLLRACRKHGAESIKRVDGIARRLAKEAK